MSRTLNQMVVEVVDYMHANLLVESDELCVADMLDVLASLDLVLVEGAAAGNAYFELAKMFADGGKA